MGVLQRPRVGRGREAARQVGLRRRPEADLGAPGAVQGRGPAPLDRPRRADRGREDKGIGKGLLRFASPCFAFLRLIASILFDSILWYSYPEVRYVCM